jgi:beta-phosphoglucomutase family hydrolase
MSFCVIFDWDGVIIDSSPYHQQAWQLLSQEQKRVLPPDYFLKSFGMKNELIIPEILQWTRDPADISAISSRKEELYRTIVRKNGIAPLPGVVPFLQMLKNNRIPCAVGSSTMRLNLACVFELTGLAGYFTAVISADDVVHGKPAPDIFLKAAARLDFPPQQCLVVEDALVGIEAARSGNMKVIAVTTTNPAPALSHADLVVDRLDTISLEQLTGIFR